MITLIVKVTLVLAAGAAVAALVRKRPAATRHFVWALTLFSTLLLLALAAIAPELPVVIPYGVDDVAVTGTRFIPSPDRIASRRDLPLPQAGEDLGAPLTRSTIILSIWLAGVASVLGWWIVGYVGLTRIARSATCSSDELVNGRTVRVAASAAVGAPVTWGWIRPIVLLPADADAWPHERRRAALLHELAHVARHDALSQFIATLACAIYWFHPMVWIAARRLRSEAEHASDDRVLSAGMKSSDYAAHLLGVANARCPGALFALGMACPSHLETRVRAVLDHSRARDAGSPRMRIVAAALVALALVPLAACRTELRAATRAIKESSKGPESIVERTVDAAPGETLILDLKTGASVDVVGTSEARVSVRAHMRGKDAADARVDVVRTGDGVRVSSDYVGSRSSRSTSIALEIRVPTRFDVQLDSSGGGLSIAEVEGTFSGETGGGAFVLKHLKGRADLSTGGGDIDVSDSELDGSVTTGGGTVTLSRVRGGLKADSGSGPVIHHDEASGRLSMEKAGGNIDLDEAPNGAHVSTGGGTIEIRRGAGVVEAHTGGGDIEIGPVRGSVVAGTGAGRVHVIIDVAPSTQSVEITTGSGSAIVELPSSLDARFELETASTETHAAGHIDSAWELERQPLTDWNDREGTPRRYLRATGVAGSGRGLVRIRVVNGSITLKRRAQ